LGDLDATAGLRGRDLIRSNAVARVNDDLDSIASHDSIIARRPLPLPGLSAIARTVQALQGLQTS